MKRINATLTDRTAKALALLMESGDNLTDVVNQSVQKNAYLDWVTRVQHEKIFIESADGTQRELVWGFDVPEGRGTA